MYPLDYTARPLTFSSIINERDITIRVYRGKESLFFSERCTEKEGKKDSFPFSLTLFVCLFSPFLTLCRCRVGIIAATSDATVTVNYEQGYSIFLEAWCMKTSEPSICRPSFIARPNRLYTPHQRGYRYRTDSPSSFWRNRSHVIAWETRLMDDDH